MADIDRIYDILQRQGETLARVAQSQDDIKERLFGGNGQPGALHFLQTEISATNAIVTKQGGQITFFRGAVAVLSFLWAAALAVGAAVIKRR